MVAGDRGQMAPILGDEFSDLLCPPTTFECHVDQLFAKFLPSTDFYARQLSILDSPRFECRKWAEQVVKLRDDPKARIQVGEFQRYIISDVVQRTDVVAAQKRWFEYVPTHMNRYGPGDRAEIVRQLADGEAVVLCSRWSDIRAWNTEVLDYLRAQSPGAEQTYVAQETWTGRLFSRL